MMPHQHGYVDGIPRMDRCMITADPIDIRVHFYGGHFIELRAQEHIRTSQRTNFHAVMRFKQNYLFCSKYLIQENVSMISIIVQMCFIAAACEENVQV